MPIVSVNIPCYNSVAHLRETIDSVLCQTLEDIEVIIIDDGSSDDTGEIVASFKDARIQYHYQDNKGLPGARNKALEMSRGKYIAFLDHDDIWLPTKLQKQVRLLESDANVGLIYSNYFCLFPNGKRKIVLKGPQPHGNAFEGFLCRYPVGILTAVVRKKAIDDLGLSFDEGVTLCEDYDYFIRLAHGTKVAYIQEPLALYRIHAGMQSIKFGDRYSREVAYIVDKLKKSYPDLEGRYADAMSHVSSMIDLMRAKTALVATDPLKARDILAKTRWTSHDFFLLYCASYMPHKVLKLLKRFSAQRIDG